MPGDDYRDILAFIAVAKERSFTRAAARLGLSQSALSHTIRGIETRLGVRLLTRTTRSVAPTEAGTRLLEQVGPSFDHIAQTLTEFDRAGSAPQGRVRISASDFAFRYVLWPKLKDFHQKHPDILVDAVINGEFAEDMTERADASVRYGNAIARDVTSVRISPDLKMVIVGAPDYFARHGRPPEPASLTVHNCVTLANALDGNPLPWELKQGKRKLQVRVTGTWIFNSVDAAFEAAMAGVGLALVPLDLAETALQEGRIEAVLENWAPTVPGFHLSFSKARQSTALNAVVDFLRLRAS